MSTIDNISGVDIYQIMDEEDKKLEEAQEVIKKLTVQTRFTDEKKTLLLKKLQGLICDFADELSDEEIEESRYEKNLRKLDDYYIIRYKKYKCKDDKCQICKSATVTTQFAFEVSGSEDTSPGHKIINPQCTSTVSGDTFDCKYEYDKSEGQGRELDITCTTNNVIFLLTCQDCGEQFVGQTGPESSLKDHYQDLLIKMTHFLPTVNQNEEDSKKEEGQQSNKCETFSVQIIQKLPGSETNDEYIDRERDQWIKKLMTYYPYGMNRRLKENEKPLYSKKFFELFKSPDNDGNSVTSIVEKLRDIRNSEDSRPMIHLHSIFACLAETKKKSDLKKKYACAIDKDRNPKSDQLNSLIEDIVRRSTPDRGVKYERCSAKKCTTCDDVLHKAKCYTIDTSDTSDTSDDTALCRSTVKSMLTDSECYYDCIYEFSEGEEMTLSCSAKYVIYLLTCVRCKEQYVGYASENFKERMDHHRSKPKEHFTKADKNPEAKRDDLKCYEFTRQIIHKLPGKEDNSSQEDSLNNKTFSTLNESSRLSDINSSKIESSDNNSSDFKKKTTKKLGEVEGKWIKDLATFFPYPHSMNERKAKYTLYQLELDLPRRDIKSSADDKSATEITKYLLGILEKEDVRLMKHLSSILENLSHVQKDVIEEVERKYLDESKTNEKNKHLDAAIKELITLMKTNANSISEEDEMTSAMKTLSISPSATSTPKPRKLEQRTRLSG